VASWLTLTMLGSNLERHGYDSQLSLDTMMSSAKTAANQSAQCEYSQAEYRSSVPTSKTQLLSARDYSAAAQQLDPNARKPAGYEIILSSVVVFH